MQTLDGHRYAFQAAGEFVWLTSQALEVQVRFQGRVGRNTSTQATAIGTGAHVLESYFSRSSRADVPSLGDGLPVVVDGHEMTVDLTGTTLSDGTYLARRSTGVDGRTLLVVAPDGTWVQVENLHQSQNIIVGMSDTPSAQSAKGLVGTPDGNRRNDFTLRNGTVLGFADARTVEGLYGRFAGSWRVEPSQRLFSDGTPEDYRTDAYLAHPSKATSLADFTAGQIAAARDTCQSQGLTDAAALEDCAYDVLVAGAQWAAQASESTASEGLSDRVRERARQKGGEDDPLLVAADRCRTEDIAAALKAGADPDLRRVDDGETPLRFAAHSGCTQGVRQLLSAGANPDLPNDDGFTPLYQAASRGFSDIVKALIAGGADVGQLLPSGEGPLLAAAYRGHDQVASLLLGAAAPADVARSADGFTPLLAAVQQRKLKAASVLLESGADPDRTNADGETALMVAADRGSVDLITLLARAAADPDRRRIADGTTALMFAADKDAQVVLALLNAGADPGIADDDGVTPLHIAASKADPSIIRALLADGASADARDDRGRTPRDVAKPEVADLLR